MALLRVADLTKRFGGFVALNAVSLAVRRGELVGLIGPNGAGKTTFFNVISGFLRPDGGEVRFDGHDLGRLPPHVICRLGLARTFQLVQPFGGLSVLDNIALGALFGRREAPRSLGAARAEAARLLDLVQLADEAARPASALTLVARKRLELARALATDPALVCLDEVMAGLAPAELPPLLETVARINGDLGVTMLLVEHNVRLVTDLCRRVVVLDCGEVIADGPPDDVMRHPRVVAAYLGRRPPTEPADA